MFELQSEPTSRIARRLLRIIAMHFDPVGGSRYWLERERALGIDARSAIRDVEDLRLLGPMDESDLASRPIEDLIPQSLHGRRAQFIIAETAGTLGRAKFAVHRRDEFVDAFVTPFTVAAERSRFPRELNWLFIGPSGPHIIGKAACACANALGSPDPFTIDLDPRWAKKLPTGSLGWRRYLDHVESQSLRIIESQQIGVLFSTPIVLQSLVRLIDAPRRRGIRGLHLGGVSVSAEQRRLFADAFPEAVILSGYGNSLFGVMPETWFDPETGFTYQPHGQRLIARIVPLSDAPATDRLQRDVEYGERGQVVISRLDETQMIVNLMERDSAIRVPPTPSAIEHGFARDGVCDPRAIVSDALKPSVGFY